MLLSLLSAVVDHYVVFLQAPLWAYLLCAVGLFVYQSLDAIDGKQARRTNSSSPLGELFDHGCDSLSTGNYVPTCRGAVSLYVCAKTCPLNSVCVLRHVLNSVCVLRRVLNSVCVC